MNLANENDFSSFRLERGDVLFKYGDTCDHAYLLQEGHVACFLLSEDKRIIPLFTKKDVGLIGEQSLFHESGPTYTFYAVALSGSTLYKIPREEVLSFLGEAGLWIKNILSDISGRLEKTSLALQEHKIIDSRLNENEDFEVEDIKVLLNAIS